jgi:hypothetical protein
MTEEISQEEIRDKVDEIVSDGERITERVSALILSVLKSAEGGLSKFGDITERVLDGAVKGTERAVPQDPESVLRKVYDGVTDAGEKAAESVKLTFQEARSRGEKFGTEEYDKVIQDLGALEENLVSSVKRFTESSRSELSAQVQSISEHVHRAGTGMGPALQAALSAAKEHPSDLIRESAQAGADLTRHIVGDILGAASRFLDGAADSLRPSSEKEKGSNPDSESGTSEE